LTTVIDAAPASAVSTAIARAAPPAPNSTTRRPAGSITVRSAVRKPWPSVFSPPRRRAAAGATSQVRYRASSPWFRYAASIITTVGFSAAGMAKQPVSRLMKLRGWPIGPPPPTQRAY